MMATLVPSSPYTMNQSLSNLRRWTVTLRRPEREMKDLRDLKDFTMGGKGVACRHSHHAGHPGTHPLHSTPYTQHPTPFTLHPTFYTLHPTPYTLQPYDLNYFTEMCSGSDAGSYLRLIDFVYHSTLGLRVIKKKKTLNPKRELQRSWRFGRRGKSKC